MFTINISDFDISIINERDYNICKNCNIKNKSNLEMNY